jgi:hypothetical protein
VGFSLLSLGLTFSFFPLLFPNEKSTGLFFSHYNLSFVT